MHYEPRSDQRAEQDGGAAIAITNPGGVRTDIVRRGDGAITFAVSPKRTVPDFTTLMQIPPRRAARARVMPGSVIDSMYRQGGRGLSYANTASPIERCTPIKLRNDSPLVTILRRC